MIGSLNARGLSNNMKRREVFRWLKNKKCSIFFLQEVHCSKDKEATWSAEWGYTAIFSSLSSASAGVSILFNNNFVFQLLKTFSDPNGRFVITDIKTESRTLTLVNIYAPNNDDSLFFESVLRILLTFECEECVWGGDFNLVLDVRKDKQGGRPVTHEKSLEKVKYIIDSLDLVDIWRMFNPDVRHFTWRRSCPEIKCRLDFFLISSSLIPAVTSADILAGFKSDHSLITLTLMNNSNPRGPGFWKLNASLLADAEYIELIKKTINEVAKEYQNNNEVDAILLWDTMKIKIRSSSLCYARQKKNKMSSKENYLEEKITYLQKRLDEANVTAMEKQQITEEIGIINSQRDEISEYKTKGAIIRSRARWYNDGEKNTKYFLNLEKRHLKQKTIKCLHLSDNEVVNTDEEILKEAKSFYQKLYSSTVSSTDNQCDEIFFPLGNIETLTEREQNECGCLLTEAECWECLKSMQPNKSPGTDGLSPEFYKVFWKDISFHLLNALNHAYIKIVYLSLRGEE